MNFLQIIEIRKAVEAPFNIWLKKFLNQLSDLIKGLASRLWESHGIIYMTRKHKRTIKFEGIQTELPSLGAPNENDGWKIAINDKHHLIGQKNFNNGNYCISTTFLCLAIFCCLYLVQDSFTDYLLCGSSDECVAGHNERITLENQHTNFVWFSLGWGQARLLI